MKALGFHYSKGNQHNILHDTKANIDFKNVYLKRGLAHLNANELPVMPEVFIDESYYHLDHHAHLIWVPTKGVVNECGHKPMLVIFGTFVVFQQDNKLEANMVHKSVLIWPIKGKRLGIVVCGCVAPKNEL